MWPTLDIPLLWRRDASDGELWWWQEFWDFWDFDDSNYGNFSKEEYKEEDRKEGEEEDGVMLGIRTWGVYGKKWYGFTTATGGGSEK